MKFSANQSQLNKILSVVHKCVPSRPQLPVLGSFLLKVEKNTLTISATDLYIGARASLQISSSEDGEIAIPAKQFKQIINSSPREELTFEVVQNNCVISSQHTKMELVSMMGEEFPEFPTISTPKNELDVRVIQKISKWVLPSASSDPTRPILTAALLTFSSKSLRAVCTDGFRLALLTIPCETDNMKEEQQLLLPSRALRDIARIVEEEKIETITLTVDQDQKQSVITVGDYQYFLRILEGEYPPYQKIIPEETSVDIIFDKNELLENLQRAMIFNQDNSYIFSLDTTSSPTTISSTSSSIGVFRSELPLAKKNNSNGSIAFNTRYIIDLLQEIPDETIEFGMKDSLKPAWFKAPSEPTFLYVVMPFRISAQ